MDHKIVFFDGEYVLKFILDKNPFNFDSHEKMIEKFASNNKIYEITVFFSGVLSSHTAILNKKYELLNSHYKKRTANKLKLHSQSNYMTSILLKKYGVKVVFSYEKDLQSTLLQYALNAVENTKKTVLIVTSEANYKLPEAHSDFQSKIFFSDIMTLSANKDNKLTFKSSIISKFENKKQTYYLKERDSNQENVVDEKTIFKWKEQIVVEPLPKCLDDYREVIDLTIKNSFILASGSFILHELGNPFTTLTKLRQALYFKLGYTEVLEEVMEYSSAGYQFIPYLIISDQSKEKELNYTPEKVFKLMFHNLDKSSNVLFTEYNNHVCSVFAEICLILSLANKNCFFELLKNYGEKIRPTEKIAISKVCLTCQKKFSMKESLLEIYILNDLNYPSNCQTCIDERHREKKMREEFELSLQAELNKQKEAKEAKEIIDAEHKK